MHFLLVGPGGAVGSVARYALVLPFAGLASTRHALSPDVALFLMVGVCGGQSTVSSFSLPTFELLRMGHPVQAIADDTAVVASPVTTTLAHRWVIPTFY